MPLPSEKPVIVPDVTAAVQLKTAPAVLLVRAIPVIPPEQKACEEGSAVTTGSGFTVITAVNAGPVHPLANGVMV